jgi:hypothetical protein
LFPKASSYNNLSKQVSNPFENLSKYFEESNLINIDYKNVTIQIPWLTEEDITKQIKYFEEWLTNQKEIVDKWKELI